jgi:hypothetical protein
VTPWPRLLGFGVLSWLISFAVAFLIFPVRDSLRPLFESIMAVTVPTGTVVLGLAYLRRLSQPTVRDGLVAGLVWLAVNVAIDAPLMLLGGPMRMSVGMYLADIGVTYLGIPVVTTGLALARAR